MKYAYIKDGDHIGFFDSKKMAVEAGFMDLKKEDIEVVELKEISLMDAVENTYFTDVKNAILINIYENIIIDDDGFDCQELSDMLCEWMDGQSVYEPTGEPELVKHKAKSFMETLCRLFK